MTNEEKAKRYDEIMAVDEDDMRNSYDNILHLLVVKTEESDWKPVIEPLRKHILKSIAVQKELAELKDFIELIPNASITLDLDEHMENYKKAMKEHEELVELKKKINLANEPLTDEERKWLKDNGWQYCTFNAPEDDNKSYDDLFICELNNYNGWKNNKYEKYIEFFGIGHTPAQAERDAYEQAREGK